MIQWRTNTYHVPAFSRDEDCVRTRWILSSKAVRKNADHSSAPGGFRQHGVRAPVTDWFDRDRFALLQIMTHSIFKRLEYITFSNELSRVGKRLQ